jgi:hypothetical protein
MRISKVSRPAELFIKSRKTVISSFRHRNQKLDNRSVKSSSLKAETRTFKFPPSLERLTERGGHCLIMAMRILRDHEELLEALAWVQESMYWPLGGLLDGHEFILILQARRRFRPSSARRSMTSG